MEQLDDVWRKKAEPECIPAYPKDVTAFTALSKFHFQPGAVNLDGMLNSCGHNECNRVQMPNTENNINGIYPALSVEPSEVPLWLKGVSGLTEVKDSNWKES